MAGKEIGINITAKDNASSTIQKVGKSLDKTGQSAKSVAEDIADGLGTAADQLSAELGKAKKAADALTHALGPEMAQKVDVHQQVIEFNRLGATFEDIEANADKLGASLSKLKGAELNTVDAGFKNVNATVHETGTELDRSRGVLANFVGNAAQDIPGVAGSFGALNVAVGQFAEYATEGGIKLGGLVSALAPIAVGTVAVGLMAQHLKNISETKAFNRQQVDGFVQALRDGGTAADVMKQKILEAGQIEFRVGDMSGAKDLVPTLSKLNLNLGDYLNLVDAGPEKLDAWMKSQFGISRSYDQSSDGFQRQTKEMSALGDKYGDVRLLFDAIIQAQKNGTAASLKASQATAVLMDTMKYTTPELAAVASAAETTGASFNAVEKAAISTGDAVDTGLGAAFGRTAVKAGDMADEAGILATALGDVETAWKSLTGTLDDKAAQRSLDESDARLAEMKKAATTGYVKTGKKDKKGKPIYRTVRRAPTVAEQRAIDAEGESNIRQRLAQAEKASQAELDAYSSPNSVRNKTATAKAVETTLRVRIQPYVDAGDEAEVKKRLDNIAALRIIPFEPVVTITGRGGLTPDGGLDPTAVAEAIAKAKKNGTIPP